MQLQLFPPSILKSHKVQALQTQLTIYEIFGLLIFLQNMIEPLLESSAGIVLAITSSFNFLVSCRYQDHKKNCNECATLFFLFCANMQHFLTKLAEKLMGRCCCIELRLPETDMFCNLRLLSGYISQESNHLPRLFFIDVINTPEYC